MGDDRPFVCSAPGCGQRFTNEDHLAVHKHKHEMTLKFGQTRTDTVIIADVDPVAHLWDVVEPVNLEQNYTADESAVDAPLGHVHMDQNLKGMFPTPCGIHAMNIMVVLEANGDPLLYYDVPNKVADQTPTPTRFLKNCEEVGLFSELDGSFEQELRKNQEEEERRAKTTLSALHTSDMKEREGPLEIDSSPPDSPSSTSSMSESKDSVTMLKEPVTIRNNKDMPSRTAASSAPTPTIVRPGSLPLHLGYDTMNPTQPSPTSVITRTPPSNRLSSPSASFPMMMQLPNGQTVPLLPSPGQTSVISLARSSNTVPNIPGIPGPPIGGNSSGSSSPSGYSSHNDAKMRLKAALSPQSVSGPTPTQKPEPSETLSPAQPQVSPAPPRGGRRRRAAEAEPDERRRRFLERNRAAAYRCRQKRKVWVNALEKRAEELATANVTLTNEVSLLRTEVTRLKELLLTHKDCPVTAMQKKAYLAAGVDESAVTALVLPGSTPAPVSVNGLSVRAAEAVAVLAGMGSGQWSGSSGDVPSQSQPTSR